MEKDDSEVEQDDSEVEQDDSEVERDVSEVEQDDSENNECFKVRFWCKLALSEVRETVKFTTKNSQILQNYFSLRKSNFWGKMNILLDSNFLPAHRPQGRALAR